jgi:hypothetical protein
MYMKQLSQKLFAGYIYLCLTWVVFALSFQSYMMYLNFSGQEKQALKISTYLTHNLDGRFK